MYSPASGTWPSRSSRKPARVWYSPRGRPQSQLAVQLVYGYAAIQEEGVLVHGGVGGLQGLALLAHGSHDDGDQLLEGGQSGDAAVFVDNHGHGLSLGLEFRKEAADGLGLRHEVGRSEKVRNVVFHLQASITLGLEHVLYRKDSDYVVHSVHENGEAGVVMLGIYAKKVA